MTETITKHEKTLSALIHASTFSKFFIPFGNFIIPLVLWTANKKEYSFVDYNGKQAINFQISLLLYSILLGIISVPFIIGMLPNIMDFNLFGLSDLSNYNNLNLHFNLDNFSFTKWMIPLGVTGLAQAALFIVNVVYTIMATLKTNEGETFSYPVTIKFIK
ncbi:DUF4870 domain-containing protein [uncultured Maribacter sp.]|uniref:DUF4870 domain-containing protein n=1 Tax=uncultured Maribacter sp. TaxID=431308 RepID=UPI00261B58D7|nr:DUF4870 domain-containing protein [uncultured Maribacter sp.]